MSNRREFLQATGALAICFSVPACSEKLPPLNTGRAVLGNRLVVEGTGNVRLMLGKVEFGQGIGTALAQMVAEELDVDFSRIHLVAVDTNISPDEFYTFSSISIQQSGPPTRRAAAAAKDYMLQQAALQLGESIDALSVVDGEIYVDGEVSEQNYWAQIGNKRIEIDISDDQTLKSVNNYSVVGESCKRIDIPGKVFGDASYLQDLRLPDMVHARVVRPPAERAIVESFDDATVSFLPGVLKVVRDGNFVAVIAEREGQARAAANELRRSISWRLAGDMPDENDIYSWLKMTGSKTESVASKQLEPVSQQAEAVKHIYQRPYQAHASISPSAAIAKYDGEKLTVRSHAQGMYPLRMGIAHVLNLDIENVRCIHHEASGCYGHNGADDAACDAAALAMHLPGVPVRLQWERADEMTWEPYGSAMQIEISADVDQSGNIENWQQEIWSTPHTSRPRSTDNAGNMIYAQLKEEPLPLPPIQSIAQPNGGADRNGIPLYEFNNLEVNKHLVTDVPIRVSALRGLGAYGNVFSIESFMDELALRGGVDPLEYRIRHLGDERAIALLGKLAELSGWRQRSPGVPDDGWGMGFARFKNRSSYVGVVMRVSVDMDSEKIELKQAYAVCDAGLIINPDGASAQIEGGVVQSSSWTIKEQIRFSNSEKQSRDWASYPILRFDEVPDVTVAFMERKDHPSLGLGEAAQGPTAAAIANAVFDATGERCRRLPLRPWSNLPAS
jgi:CO/xanthine dehydrogenase Mo-binding subunit